MTTTVLAAAIVLTGLSAGLFATFSYAVMPGLRRADDATFVAAMRGVNVAILNPALAVVLGGSVVMTAAALVAGWNEPTRPWVVAGLVLNVAGGWVVTGLRNVPRNEALEAGTGDPAMLREAFEGGWVTWNHVRSVLTTAAFVCLVVGALQR